MKFASWNVNGLRSVWGKGLLKWMSSEAPDVVCLQEVKTHPSRFEEGLLHPLKMESYWHPAERAGYSGVMIYSREEPKSIRYGIGCPDIDREGRVISAAFGDYVLVNAYFPNSRRDHSRLDYKLFFCEKIHAYLDSIVASGNHVILCGDINIAHKEIDLKNPKQNAKNAGFLPQERAWMDRFLSQRYCDAFRQFTPEGGHYTWWSYRPTIRERNIGWRLDYFFVDRDFKDRLKKTSHRTQILGSDHCPIVLEIT